METTFNENAQDYSAVRPGYPNELYLNVSKFISLDKNSSLLEIGAGHGIATKEISLLWNSSIIAIEPGKTLFDLANTKFDSSSKVSFINSTYEDYETDEKFDCIYAATAFHWISQSVKFKKSFDLLKKDGILFLFWNYYTIKDNIVFEDIQNIYKNYHPQGTGNKDVRILTRNKIEQRKQEVENCNLFNHLDHFEINKPLKLNSDQYIKLLKTFPNNNLLKEEIKGFYSKIKEYIIKQDNIIELNIIVCSEISKKMKS